MPPRHPLINCEIPVAPASCRLSRGRPALGWGGETPPRQPPGRRHYTQPATAAAALKVDPAAYTQTAGYRAARVLLLPPLSLTADRTVAVPLGLSTFLRSGCRPAQADS